MAKGIRIPDHFWGRVQESSPDECWEWMGARNPWGYGNLKFGRGFARAHRVAWELSNALPVPPGMVVMHECDNPACCNPDHLRVGTQGENMADMKAKGRLVGRGADLKPRNIVRITHCKRGHEFTPENTHMYRGRRRCRACMLRVNRR